MFNKKTIKNNLKKVVVLGVALAGISGIGAVSANNFSANNVHADSMAQVLKNASHHRIHGTMHLTHRQELLSGAFIGDKSAYKNYQNDNSGNKNNNSKKPVAHKSHKTNPCKPNYKNINRKSRKHVTHKARKANKVRKHVARKARKNTRGYKNKEVKNLAITLNRLDKKAVRTHGRKRAKLIKNMRHVNGRLIKLVGKKKGSRRTHGYKNHEVKNIAITLNRIDKKANREHGRKYAKLIKNLKHCNYTLIQLAK